MTPILFSLFQLGCIPHSVKPQTLSKTVDIPLYRSTEEGQRLFVQLDLPVVGPQYFMVDTGASVSAIRQDLAEEMAFPVVQKNGFLTGVSGSIPWIEASIPDVSLGPVDLDKVNFAVGVDGIPERAGLVPIAGVIGNNVWSRFIVDIDYGAEILRLHPSFEFSDSASNMRFDDQNILAGIQLTYGEDTIIVTANVDTGSSGLILNAAHVPVLAKQAQESKEAILGVGADVENMQDYVIDTLMLPIEKTKLGGHTLDTPINAVLLNPPNPDFMSLVGYEVFEHKRLIVDYKNERIALIPSQIDLPPRNLHKEYLKAIQWGQIEADPLMEVQLHFFLNQRTAGLRKLKRLHDKETDPKYALMLANVHFDIGDIDSAIDYLETLSTDVLIEQEYIQALTLAYLYTEQFEQASKLLDAMTAADFNDVWWLKSMMALLQDDVPSAKTYLYQANQYSNPNDYLVFHAILKYNSNDITGTVAKLRKDVHLHPLGNHSLWFLAKVAKGTPYEDLAIQTIQEKLTLQHSRRGSLDFLSGALWEIGESESALEIAKKGKKRDCENPDSDMKTNCLAWYDALTHQNLTEQITAMTKIVEANPGRSDYADTLAVLYRASGELELATQLSKKALIFGGADPYMMWQHFISESSLSTPTQEVDTETP